MLGDGRSPGPLAAMLTPAEHAEPLIPGSELRFSQILGTCSITWAVYFRQPPDTSCSPVSESSNYLWKRTCTDLILSSKFTMNEWTNTQNSFLVHFSHNQMGTLSSLAILVIPHKTYYGGMTHFFWPCSLLSVFLNGPTMLPIIFSFSFSKGRPPKQYLWGLEATPGGTQPTRLKWFNAWVQCCNTCA